jgi:hypothetical protein
VYVENYCRCRKSGEAGCIGHETRETILDIANTSDAEPALSAD